MKVTVRNVWLVASSLMMSASVFAEEAGHVAQASAALPLGAFVKGLGMALAVVAAATAQGKIASAFMDGVSRNPGAQKGMFVPLILGLAFVETLVLFTVYVVGTIN